MFFSFVFPSFRFRPPPRVPLPFFSPSRRGFCDGPPKTNGVVQSRIAGQDRDRKCPRDPPGERGDEEKTFFVLFFLFLSPHAEVSGVLSPPPRFPGSRRSRSKKKSPPPQTNRPPPKQGSPFFAYIQPRRFLRKNGRGVLFEMTTPTIENGAPTPFCPSSEGTNLSCSKGRGRFFLFPCEPLALKKSDAEASVPCLLASVA